MSSFMCQLKNVYFSHYWQTKMFIFFSFNTLYKLVTYFSLACPAIVIVLTFVCNILK